MKKLLLLGLIFLFSLFYLYSQGTATFDQREIFILLLVLGLILIITKITDALFEKIIIPSIIAEIIVGIILGNLIRFQIVNNSFFPNFFEQQNHFILNIMYIFCHIAIFLIFFILGLDTNYSISNKPKFINIFIALISSLFCFIGVYFINFHIFPALLIEKASNITLFYLAIITITTSTGITALTLSNKNLISSIEGKTIISASLIQEFLSILIFSFSLLFFNLSQINNTATIFSITIKILLALIIFGFLTIILSNKLQFLAKFFKHRTDLMITIFSFILLISILLERYGFSLIMTSYLSGIALAKSKISQIIKSKIKPLYSLFSSLFFCTAGLLTDISILTKKEFLIFLLIFTTAIITLKTIGVLIPALFNNFNIIGALRISVGLLPMGETSIAIAFFSLILGYIPKDLFSIIIMMILITAILNVAFIPFIFNSKKGIKKIEIEEESIKFSLDFSSIDIADLVLMKLLNLFNKEGFQIRIINKKEELYHIKKEDNLIVINREKEKLCFSLLRKNENFLYTSIYIVLVDLEETMKKISLPLNKENILKKIQNNSGVGMQFDIAQYLSPELIILNLKGNSKNEVIEELVNLLYRKDIIKDKEIILKSILEREEIMSTGMQNGIAIPHCRTDEVKDLICVIGIKKEGVDFDSIDRQPAKIIILTLSPKTIPTPHIQLMSGIAQKLTEENRKKILNAATIGEIYSIFTEKNVPNLSKKNNNYFINLIDHELIITSLKSNTKEEVIEELLTLINSKTKLKNYDKIKEAIFEREKLVSTGLSEGIAIPHCRTEFVDRIITAIGIKKEGLDFESLDNQPSYVIILTLIPKSKEHPYSQFISLILKGILNIGINKLIKIKDKKEIYNLLTEELRKY